MIENSITEGTRLIVRDINDEMESAFIDYSMSVITQRALPDVRDGLKPVHAAFCTPCTSAETTPATPRANLPIRWVLCWALTTRTATPLCTTPWCAWRRIFHALPSGGRAGQLWLCGR